MTPVTSTSVAASSGIVDAAPVTERRGSGAKAQRGRIFAADKLARRVVRLGVVGAMLTLPTVAMADLPPAVPPLNWDPAWTHAGVADYALTGIGITALGLELGLVEYVPSGVRWTAPLPLDEGVRKLLRGGTEATRANASTASWVLMGVGTAYSVVVDVPYAWARYGPTLAWDLFWQDATALSLATAVDMSLSALIGRARPPVSACLAAGGGLEACVDTNNEAARSFPGGHVAVVSTGAGLVCAQHLSLQLYGPPWDALTCAAAVSAAMTVGALRIVADNHWASDILAGSALGFALGWGIPNVMHLHGHAASGAGAVIVPVPMTYDHGAGIGVTGAF